MHNIFYTNPLNDIPRNKLWKKNKPLNWQFGICSPVNFAGIWMLHSSSTTQSWSLASSSAWIFSAEEMQREGNRNVVQFSDAKSDTDLNLNEQRQYQFQWPKKKIRKSRQNTSVVKQKMSLYEAMCILTLRLKVLLDICLTIPTVSTQRIFFYVWNICCKTKIKIVRSINVLWV